MKWNELSMLDKAYYINVGVQNGITSLNNIIDAYNSYAGGGELENRDSNDRIITTGNEYGDIALSFLPIAGTAMDWEQAIREPSIGNYAWAIGDTMLDLIGGSLIKGGVKAYKAVKAYKKAENALEAVKAAQVGAMRASNPKKIRMLLEDAQKIKARNPKPNPKDLPDFMYSGVQDAIDYSPFIMGVGVQPAANGLQYLVETLNDN